MNFVRNVFIDKKYFKNNYNTFKIIYFILNNFVIAKYMFTANCLDINLWTTL